MLTIHVYIDIQENAVNTPTSGGMIQEVHYRKCLTMEQKENKSKNEKLLYQVLCMMLPFHVTMNLSNKQRNIDFDTELTIDILNKFTFYRINYNMRPRLRLWDDMVRKEVKYEDEQFMFDAPLMVYNKAPDYVMWLLSLHIDAFNLIPKGLALKKLEK